MTLLSTI